MASKITAARDEQALTSADIIQPLTSRSLFWQANYLTGGSATDMLSFLFWCVESTSPRVLVSLTRNSGESYFAMCQAIERLSLDTRCFNIAFGTPDDAICAYNTNNFEDFSILLDSTPAKAAERFADHSIDLLYIDLAHLSADLLKDLGVWKSRLSPRSVLLLHGVRNPELAETCRECLAQLGVKTLDFTLEHGAGMGVVLNPETPARMVRLAQIELGQPGYAEVQKVFFRLGKAQQNAYLVRNAEHVRSQLNADIVHMRKQAKQAQAEAEAATQKTAKLREAYEVRNQHSALAEARHFDTVTALQSALDKMQATHDGQIGELGIQIAALITQVENLTAQNSDLTAQVQSPRSTLEDQTRIEELNDTVQRQDEELAALVTGLEEMRTAYEGKISWLRDAWGKAKESAAEAASEHKIIAQKLTAQTNEIERLTATLSEQEQSLETTAADHAALVQALHSEIEEHKRHAQTQTDELVTLTRLLETQVAQRQADQRKAQIATEELNAHIDILNITIAKLDDKNDLQSEELATLTRMIEGQAAQRDAQQEWHSVQIDLRNAEIAMLRGAGGRLKRGDAPSRAGLPSVKKQVQICRESDLFDPAWYLKTYRDVAESGTEPALHYIMHGALDGRNPGPAFDTMGYYLANRDVAQRGFNALVHFVMFGRDEKRKLSKVR